MRNPGPDGAGSATEGVSGLNPASIPASAPRLLRVGIVGCGIAGMAAAIACARQGFRVTVLERFETPRPIGAGLLLQPSGLRALDALGLRAAIEASGARIATLDGRTAAGKPVLDLVYRRYAPDAYGLGIHRGALFQALQTALKTSGAEVRLGVEAVDLDASADGVTVHDSARRRHGSFDVLLIADGSHSALREKALPSSKAPLFRWGALWTVRPDRVGRWDGALRQVYDGAHKMAGVLPLGRNAAGVPEAAFFWSLRVDRYEAWRAAGLEAWRAEVAALWPAAARLLVGMDDPDQATFATYRDVRAAPWRAGRILAIGDAAHGTSPQLGQGANLALADGVAIAACLRDRPADPQAALRRFRAVRKGPTGWIQLMSRALTPAFQSDGRVIAWARDAFMRDAARFPPIERLMLATLVGAVRAAAVARRAAPNEPARPVAGSA